ncbi:MAG: LLM class flavin-dependent oxidoreductase [Acidimicrobiia bacterium]
MRLGMYIDMRNPPEWQRPWPQHYGRWLERIEEAERLGAEMVWLTEHHFFDDGYLPQCFTLAAAIAARTTTIRIGTAVALLPLHLGIEMAEQVALCDVISGGRMEPGFGVGYRKPEYLAFDGDFKHRYRVFAERVREMRRLWGEEPFDDAQLVTPPPVQRPMPLWFGFGGPDGARLAGRLGGGLLSGDAALLEPYLVGLERGGHDRSRAKMTTSVEFLLADDPERAWNIVQEHAAYRWNSYARYMFEGTRRAAPPPVTAADWADTGGFVIGTPEHIAGVIRDRIGNLPVTDVYGWSDFPGMPDELVDRHIELTFTALKPLLD